MTARAAGTIILAEGHTIDCAAVSKKRQILDEISIDAVLGNIKEWAHAGEFAKPIDADYFGNAGISDAYDAAVARKDWATVDRLILDTLAQNHSKYGRALDAEAWMQAFSGRLCSEVEKARAVFRWLDPSELQSYLGGTFVSRIEDDLTRRGFKALSMNQHLKFLSRKVMMKVPLDYDTRRRIKCVRYTSLPRQIEAGDERIEDAKNSSNASEAEVRVADGTPVPAGTTFTVQQGAPVNRRVVGLLKEMYSVKH